VIALLALLKNPLVLRLLGAVALLGALGGAYAYVRHQGYVDGYSVAHQHCEDDKAKMEKANQDAISKAADKLRQAEQELETKEGQIDDYQKIIDAAADASANAGRCGLDSDSVQRLSHIQ